MCEVTCAFCNTAVFPHTLTPSGAGSLTCSWAAFLWSLEHMRGNISTGRCAGLSLGISETTKKARIREDTPTGVEARDTDCICMYHIHLPKFHLVFQTHAPTAGTSHVGRLPGLESGFCFTSQMSLGTVVGCISSPSYKGLTLFEGMTPLYEELTSRHELNGMQPGFIEIREQKQQIKSNLDLDILY